MNEKQLNIFEPYALNEIGGRSNNEDAIYPAKDKANNRDRLFIVCDGVGGANKGEIASSLLCSNFSDFFMNNPSKNIDKNYIESALRYTELKITEYITHNPECKNMASTLTMLYLQNNCVYIAWVGDSRIYHIRNGKILYQTKDHSLVNLLIAQGELTPEEAINHPKKNQILRAVKGSDDPTKIDVKEIINIKKNDYFFLCTDGVLEIISDNILENITTGNYSNKEIINQIYNLCEGNTKDNYSCYLIQISDEKACINNQSTNNNKLNNIKLHKNKFKKIIYACLFALFLITFYLIYIQYFKNKEMQSPKNTINNKELKQNIIPSTSQYIQDSLEDITYITTQEIDIIQDTAKVQNTKKVEKNN